MRPRSLAILVGLRFVGSAAATPIAPVADPPSSDFAARGLQLELPLFDARVNASLASWPSMRQSLAITRSTYYLTHAGVLQLTAPSPGGGATLAQVALVAAADAVLTYLPPGDAWLHEEWHRAVMSRRGIHSYNGVYDFEILAGAIPVRKVRDEDLVRLKREHPAEMVRLSSAGFEAQLSLNLEFDRDRFYRGTRGAAVVTQWMETVSTLGYMLTAAYDSEDVTASIEDGEGIDAADRDFTGLDPVGWVYDLHRPDEPYGARGTHPSGVGIDRYRTEADLTGRELRYLRTQAWLSFVNLADPNLFGQYGFPVGAVAGRPVRVNATVQHVLAPFGYAIRTNLFLSANRRQWFVQVHAYVSDSLLLPGLSLELVRYPLGVLRASVSPAADLWLQPEEQRFFAASGEPGGAARLRLHLPLRSPLELFVEASGKTDGWVVGDVFLGRSLNANVGLEASLF